MSEGFGANVGEDDVTEMTLFISRLSGGSHSERAIGACIRRPSRYENTVNERGHTDLVSHTGVMVKPFQLHVYQFQDSDRFVNLESLLVQLGPRNLRVFLAVHGSNGEEAGKSELSKLFRAVGVGAVSLIPRSSFNLAGESGKTELASDLCKVLGLRSGGDSLSELTRHAEGAQLLSPTFTVARRALRAMLIPSGSARGRGDKGEDSTDGLVSIDDILLHRAEATAIREDLQSSTGGGGGGCDDTGRRTVVEEQYTLHLGHLDQFMRLDLAATHSLNLFPDSQGKASLGRNASVFGVLNHCVTKLGPRLLRRRLQQPLTCPQTLNRRLDAVEAFVRDPDALTSLHGEELRRVPDLDAIAKKLEVVLRDGDATRKKDLCGQSALRTLYSVYSFQQDLPLLIDALKRLRNNEDDGATVSVSADNDNDNDDDDDDDDDDDAARKQTGEEQNRERASTLSAVAKSFLYGPEIANQEGEEKDKSGGIEGRVKDCDDEDKTKKKRALSPGEEQRSTGLIEICRLLGGLEGLVTEVIDLEEFTRTGVLSIRDKFDASLARLRRTMRSAEAKMNTLLDDARDGWGSGFRTGKNGGDGADLKLEMDKTYGFCFRVTKRHKSKARNMRNVKTLKVLTSSLLFTTTELTPLSQRYREAAEEYTVVQEKLIGKAMTVAATYAPVLRCAAAVLGRLDLTVALAHAAVHAPGGEYVRPILVPWDHSDSEKGGNEESHSTGCLKVIGCRHPCLECLEGSGSFIANNYDLQRGGTRRSGGEKEGEEDGKKEEKERYFQVITGPNMGGKSTYIRTLGVVCVMAQIGELKEMCGRECHVGILVPAN